MPTVEIPVAEWEAFFRSFDLVHSGWLCTLEIVSLAIGAQTWARNLPLAGISADRDLGASSISVTLGTTKDTRVSHSIDAPEHVWVKRTAEGADEALEIEAGEMKTLITFRVAAMPDTVDGIA